MKRLDGLCEINALSVYIFNLLVSWFLGRFEEPRSPTPVPNRYPNRRTNGYCTSKNSSNVNNRQVFRHCCWKRLGLRFHRNYSLHNWRLPYVSLSHCVLPREESKHSPHSYFNFVFFSTTHTCVHLLYRAIHNHSDLHFNLHQGKHKNRIGYFLFCIFCSLHFYYQSLHKI